MDTDRLARKEALKRIHDAVKTLPDEDVERALKLVRTELRARGALSVLQSEIDGDEPAQQPAAQLSLDEKEQTSEVVQPTAIARARGSRRAAAAAEVSE